MNRFLSKLAAVSKVRGEAERRTGSTRKSHEDSSTASTKQFATAVRFGKKSNDHGFTFIEVLISLVLCSFMLLGFDAIELYSLRSTRSSYYLYVATNQLISMAERLHAMSQYDDISKQIAIWNLQNKELLPAGKGVVTGHFPNYILAVYWGNLSHVCNQIEVGQSGCIQQNITL